MTLQNSSFSPKLLFLISFLSLLFLFQNGFEGIIPSIAKPIFVILNLSLVLGGYLSFRRDKDPSCLKIGGGMILVLVLFFTGLVLPMYFSPSYSRVEESGERMHYYSSPHPLGYCINVWSYKEEGIYLVNVSSFDCQECSVEKCLNSRI